MIKPDGIDLLYQTIVDNVTSATVLISGVEKTVAIQKFEQTAQSIKVYVYFDETFVGTITRYRLILRSGKIFLEKSDNLVKDGADGPRGLLTLFEIDISEVG